MLRKGQQQTPDDVMTPEEEIKDPFFLEFLDLKDEYSENDLEVRADLASWKPSSSSWAATSRSSVASAGCASATRGIGSTCCSSTGACAASSSST